MIRDGASTKKLGLMLPIPSKTMSTSSDEVPSAITMQAISVYLNSASPRPALRWRRGLAHCARRDVARHGCPSRLHHSYTSRYLRTKRIATCS